MVGAIQYSTPSADQPSERSRFSAPARRISWLQIPVGGLLAALLGLSLGTAPAQAGIATICYAVADNGGAGGGGETFADRLVTITKVGGITTVIGATGTLDIEAIAFDYTTDTLYATNGGQLGSLNLVTAAFTASANPVGTCRLSGGATVAVTDVDSLTFDPFTGNLWGSQRIVLGGTPPTNDLLFQIDPVTGLLVPNTFGTNIDCARVVEASGSFLRLDLDDLAIDPSDGTLFGIDNDGGLNPDQLITINKSNGQATLVGLIGINDMEGLAFGNDGTLFGTTGNNSGVAANDNAFYTINKTTGAFITKIANFAAGNADFESVDCLTADQNIISGTVFYDPDGNGLLIGGSGDDGVQNITVRLYVDVNGDGMVDGGDILVATTTTNTSGNYQFSVAADGDFVLEIDTSTLPSGAFMTTDNVEVANFVGFGNVDTGNNFGFRTPNNDLQVTKTSDAVGDVVPGQIITYTVTVSNNTVTEHTEVVVSDPVPVGTSYVGASTVATGPTLADVFRVTEYFIASGSFTGTTYDLTLNNNLEADYFAIVQGSDGDTTSGGNRGPNRNYAALTRDPFGTGDLDVSSGANVIRLTRGAATNSWVGVVTVVECLRNCDENGFELLDVQRVAHTGVTTSGSDTSATAWGNIDQVMLLGGFNDADILAWKDDTTAAVLALALTRGNNLEVVLGRQRLDEGRKA